MSEKIRPNNSPEPTAVGAVSSAIAVHAGWFRVPELWTLGRTTPMFTNDAFMDRAIGAFLAPVIWSAVCYFAASFISRLASSEPRGIYFRRLILMLVAAFIIAGLYPALGAAFHSNAADPRNEEWHNLWMAKQVGTSYGIHAIWAWLLVALIDWPKVRPNKSPEPTAVGACSSAVAVNAASRRWLSFFR